MAPEAEAVEPAVTEAPADTEAPAATETGFSCAARVQIPLLPTETRPPKIKNSYMDGKQAQFPDPGLVVPNAGKIYRYVAEDDVDIPAPTPQECWSATAQLTVEMAQCAWVPLYPIPDRPPGGLPLPDDCDDEPPVSAPAARHPAQPPASSEPAASGARASAHGGVSVAPRVISDDGKVRTVSGGRPAFRETPAEAPGGGPMKFADDMKLLSVDLCCFMCPLALFLPEQDADDEPRRDGVEGPAGAGGEGASAAGEKSGAAAGRQGGGAEGAEGAGRGGAGAGPGDAGCCGEELQELPTIRGLLLGLPEPEPATSSPADESAKDK